MRPHFNLRLLAPITLALALPLVATAQPSATTGSSIATGRGQDSREPDDPRAVLQKLQTRYQEINEQELKEPPERDIQIETFPPEKTKLFRADPKLFENKFVAQFTLSARPTGVTASMAREIASASPTEIARQASLDSGSIGRGFGGNPLPLHEFMKALATHCPANQRPASVLDILTSQQFEHDVRFTRAGGVMHFTLYAPTAEDAQKRAEGIVRLHDCAISRPVQQYFLAEGRKHLAEASAKCDEYDRVSAEITAEQQKLAQPAEVSSDILTQLKAQRILVAVELAGLSARVKACDKMLADTTRLPASTLQSVSDMKVKAEIELVGTQEKLSRIDTYIADGNRHEAIQKKLQDLIARLRLVRSQVSNALRGAENAVSLVNYYAPRDLAGNTIKIAPVEWTDQ